ncbi:MAG TPA: zf-TFIIB domain-containing protein [Candidatus Omnitrophota bacterium]|nr:zf-TFIIB domain-containing protein [Candidatus Omnitrophota bacterium]HPB68067.1 zf-TFIIB domain-containing protein [Candidatus Omnitrophota bacterium]HQO58227.1 zf-TFIIB domain-containing protein [Candidatus Omnitrophota bacterium]HQP12162.1 zf-TFIIB domain-containing protein [Candidatus Omnitrophota bacterium]
MKCPACNRELQKMAVKDLTVDVCKGGCGGIWFDNFELRKVDEQQEAAGEALLDIPRDKNIKRDASQIKACPKCEGIKMMKHFFSVQRNVEIDECGACGGIWLDYGELGRLRQEYATEDDRKKAAQAYFADVFGGKLATMRAENQAKLEEAQRIAGVFRFMCPPHFIPKKREGDGS